MAGSERPQERVDTDTQRLEAFSDGVIAIIVTIMVLELKAPHEADGAALLKLGPTFLSYLLSFILVAIYWVNHRHVLRYVVRVTPVLLWLNIAVLFFISLIPLTTAWLGEHMTARAPNIAYGVVLIASALSYQALQAYVHSQNKHRADLVHTIRMARYKAMGGLAIYALGIAGSIFIPGAMLGAAAIVAGLYFVPVPAGGAPERG